VTGTRNQGAKNRHNNFNESLPETDAERLLRILPAEILNLAFPLLENDPDYLLKVVDHVLKNPKRSPSPHAPKRPRRWSLAESYRGIGEAGLIIVNIHDESEREQAEALVKAVHRLRSDKEVFDDVLGAFHRRVPVTALVANLAIPGDAGLKKSIARIKREIAKAKE
jgi:hypothetical protein